MCGQRWVTASYRAIRFDHFVLRGCDEPDCELDSSRLIPLGFLTDVAHSLGVWQSGSVVTWRARGERGPTSETPFMSESWGGGDDRHSSWVGVFTAEMLGRSEAPVVGGRGAADVSAVPTAVALSLFTPDEPSSAETLAVSFSTSCCPGPAAGCVAGVASVASPSGTAGTAGVAGAPDLALRICAAETFFFPFLTGFAEAL